MKMHTNTLGRKHKERRGSCFHWGMLWTSVQRIMISSSDVMQDSPTSARIIFCPSSLSLSFFSSLRPSLLHPASPLIIIRTSGTTDASVIADQCDHTHTRIVMMMTRQPPSCHSASGPLNPSSISSSFLCLLPLPTLLLCRLKEGRDSGLLPIRRPISCSP